MREAERFEDMSVRGRLRVIQQDDGDMIVSVIEDPNSPMGGVMAGVEFCASGGKSPNTLVALRALMLAMAEDNADRPQCDRRGEQGLGVDAIDKAEPQSGGWRAGMTFTEKAAELRLVAREGDPVRISAPPSSMGSPHNGCNGEIREFSAGGWIMVDLPDTGVIRFRADELLVL